MKSMSWQKEGAGQQQAQVARLHGDLAYEGELGPKARAESAAEGAFRKFWLGFAH